MAKKEKPITTTRIIPKREYKKRKKVLKSKPVPLHKNKSKRGYKDLDMNSHQVMKIRQSVYNYEKASAPWKIRKFQQIYKNIH